MGGSVVTDNVPLEIAEINAHAATTSNCITTGTSDVGDVAVLVINIKISGRGVVHSRRRCCWTKRHGSTGVIRLLAEINRRRRVQLVLFRNFDASTTGSCIYPAPRIRMRGRNPHSRVGQFSSENVVHNDLC